MSTYHSTGTVRKCVGDVAEQHHLRTNLQLKALRDLLGEHLVDTSPRITVCAFVRVWPHYKPQHQLLLVQTPVVCVWMVGGGGEQQLIDISGQHTSSREHDAVSAQLLQPLFVLLVDIAVCAVELGRQDAVSWRRLPLPVARI